MKAFLFVIPIPITISPIIIVIIAQPIALLAIQLLICLPFFVTVASQPLGMMLLQNLAMVFLFVILVFFTTLQITHATDAPSTVQHVKLVLIGLLLNARVATWLLGSTPRRKHAIPFLHVILQDTTI